jgi:hypothetical protein
MHFFLFIIKYIHKILYNNKKIYETFSLIIILINLILSSLNETIPDSFDSREKWPNCISKINNQGNCAACYAFSVSEAF